MRPRLPVSTANHLLNRQVIIVPLPMLDLVTAVRILERHAINEGHLAADHLATLQMRDVNPLHNSRRLGQLKHLLQLRHPLLRMGDERLRLPIFLIPFAGPRAQRMEGFDFIPQFRRPLEVHLRTRLKHLLFHLDDHLRLVPIQKPNEPVDILAVGLRCDLRRTRGRALPDRIKQAWPEKPPVAIRLMNFQVTGAKLERPLQKRDRFFQRINTRKRPIKFNPLRARLAGDEHSREFIPRGDHQVGECLVIQQPCVVLRLDVLDEPIFGQQRLDFAVGL